MIVLRRAYQLKKRSASFSGDYKVILVHFTAVTSKQSNKLARNTITYVPLLWY